MILARRALLLGAAASLTGCDRLARNERFREALFSAENFHRWAQRSLMARDALAHEFRPDQISPIFRANGTANPNTPEYKALWRNGFADWRLRVDGRVSRELSLSLSQLHALPHREQITRHDCVEGWSAIGKWRGVPLRTILDGAGLRSDARYLVFHCADTMGNDSTGQTPTLACRVCDFSQFAFAHAWIVLQEQCLGRLIRRKVAHIAGERDDRTGLGANLLAQAPQQCRAVEVGFLNDDHGVSLP